MYKPALLFSFLLASLLPLGAQNPCYRLVWEEPFDGTAIDTTSWTKIPRGDADWNRHMSPDPSLYRVSDGTLKLYGRNNVPSAQGDTARYITGGVFTLGKRTIRHGKVEIRARLKGATGAWPAIWMLPETGQWPRAGEIDIMERLSHDTIAYQTIHTYYTYVLKLADTPPHGSTGPIEPDGYNVYAVEILPDSLVFSINGHHTFTYPRIETDKEGQWPFGTPYYLLVDMQIEGNWVGKARPEELPAVMEVDWVKFYELCGE